MSLAKELLCGLSAFGLGLLVVGALSACSPSKPAAPPPKAECSDDQLAKLEAAYIAEAVAACAGETYDTCSELPGIRAKYAEAREAWKECK